MHVYIYGRGVGSTLNVKAFLIRFLKILRQIYLHIPKMLFLRDNDRVNRIDSSMH